ncbi:hypothetical protein GGS23DRAFT_547839 [Durotheca rogersii]|uniref:uncharacterized protein n=1 Tax=Durotheca rogersii TaxID=419775 RepID=UPI00221F47EC|nr:uncharacterized protein GGS23DRAFT_547839 [Durotheca rogersii]KAI5867327.1 hypothetical protein GGS23DRAFT_547839 [Durotheca rogersii]
MSQLQDNRGTLFLLLLLFWLATSPDSNPGFIAGPALVKSRLARQREALGILNSTQWGDFAPRRAGNPPEAESKYLNLTGFREEDGYAWEDFQRFQNRCEEWSANAVGIPEASVPVWQNATGIIRGLWHRANTSSPRYHSSYNLSQISPGVTWSGYHSEWTRNATGTDGRMLVRIEDYEDGATEPEEVDKLVLEKAEIKAREVAATINVDDADGTGSSWEMRLHGVHWPRQGVMLFTTTSEKFAGIFGLPHLTTREDFFESSKALLNRTLDKALERKEKRTFDDQFDPWTSTLDAPGEAWSPSPHCEYLLYVQIYPLDQDILGVQPTLTGPENVAKAIQDIEDELRFPQGTGHRRIPQLQMSAVVYSPDCAFFLETKGPPAYAPEDGKHLIGVKQEVFLYSVSTFLLGLAFTIFGQLQLLKMQMRETSTPSTLCRVSFYTGCIMLLADGIIFTGSAAWSFSASTTLLPSLAITCVSLLSMTVTTFFLAEIHRAQEPEWRRQERERERQNAPTSTTPRHATSPNPPDTATRRSASPPIIIPSDQDVDAEIAENTNNETTGLPAPVTAGNPTANAQNLRTQLSNVFGRLLLIGIGVLFLSLAAASWRPRIRAAYFNTVLFVYLSLWVPQIYRNAYRNCRRALAWRFVAGQSALRLLPVAYFYAVPGNFAFAEPDRAALAALAAWLWLQTCTLAAQAVLGPRFGVPRGWMPDAWEYHPVLREDNVEAGGLPIGLVAAAAPGSPTAASAPPELERDDGGGGSGSKKPLLAPQQRTSTHVIDCAICREVLEVPVIRAGAEDPAAGGVTGVLARRAYMVTPCRHIFHSACLEGWMRFRLQCPICREELPPL